MDKECILNKKILEEYYYGQHNIDQLKKLIKINKKLDKKISVLRRSIYKKQIYLDSVKKFKNISIDPNAKLIIYWND